MGVEEIIIRLGVDESVFAARERVRRVMIAAGMGGCNLEGTKESMSLSFKLRLMETLEWTHFYCLGVVEQLDALQRLFAISDTILLGAHLNTSSRDGFMRFVMRSSLHNFQSP